MTKLRHHIIGRAPEILAVYSPWGSQWYRLAMFLADLKGINLLVSMCDILQSRNSLYRTIIEGGIKHSLLRTRESYRKMYSDLVAKGQRAQEYLTYLEEETPMTSTVVVDSGGFGFTNLATRQTRRPIIDKKLPQFWTLFLRNDPRSQAILFSAQLAAKGDALISLDKVIPPTLSPREKEERVDFNLRCARRFLELASDSGAKCRLFAAVHAYQVSALGRKPHSYYETAVSYITQLLDIEAAVGKRFTGYSLGSLVPLSSILDVEAIARGVVSVLKRARPGVILHSLGTTGIRRIRMLVDLGFSVFDTNAHVKLARNRRIVLPDGSAHQSVWSVDSRRWDCDCPLCRRHPWRELVEERRHHREISTVLLSLHNYHVFSTRIQKALSREYSGVDREE